MVLTRTCTIAGLSLLVAVIVLVAWLIVDRPDTTLPEDAPPGPETGGRVILDEARILELERRFERDGGAAIARAEPQAPKQPATQPKPPPVRAEPRLRGGEANGATSVRRPTAKQPVPPAAAQAESTPPTASARAPGASSSTAPAPEGAGARADVRKI